MTPHPAASPRTCIFLAAVVLASRWPFLDAGYGNDADGWAVADAARFIATHGVYQASRLPGYPLHELTCTLFYRAGPAALNGLSAAMSALAAVSFLGVLRRYQSAHALAAALAFSMTPVSFVAGTSCIDYIWATALILASWWALLVRRPGLGGVLLGLAAGCRITSLVLVPAFLWLVLLQFDRPASARASWRFTLAALAVALAAFAPVIHQYGLGFLTFSEPPTYPSLEHVVSRSTLRVWGTIGVFAWAIALFSGLIRRPPRGDTALPPAQRNLVIPPAFLAISLPAAVFLRLPFEPGYLLPAVPFAILVGAAILSRRSFQRLCWALCLSPWLFSIGRASPGPWAPWSPRAVHIQTGAGEVVLDLFDGPILRDRRERIAGMQYVSRIMAAAAALPPRSVVLVGFWKAQIDQRLADRTAARERFVEVLREQPAQRLTAERRPIFYLPEMRDYIRTVGGIDPADFGRPLIIVQDDPPPTTPPRPRAHLSVERALTMPHALRTSSITCCATARARRPPSRSTSSA